MDWRLAAPDFEDDGALRDIYILGTTIDDWQAVWTFLCGEGERLAFTVDGIAQEPPDAIDDIFARRGETGCLAAYRLGGQVLNCHFFDIGEIEFDLSPRDVDGPEAVDTLVQFMGALGRVTAKPVILTMENSREAVIARFDPLNGEVTWQPAGG
jgi:hypothetical protein